MYTMPTVAVPFATKIQLLPIAELDCCVIICCLLAQLANACRQMHKFQTHAALFLPGMIPATTCSFFWFCHIIPFQLQVVNK